MVYFISFGDVVGMGAVNVVVKDGKLAVLLEFLVCFFFFLNLFFERPVTKG